MENGDGLNQETESTVLYHTESRDDLFLDAPDELSVSTTDSREVVGSTEAEDVTSKESNDVGEVYGVSNGEQDGTVTNNAEANESAKGYSEEEAGNFAKEVANLRHQLKALVYQQSVSGDGELVDRLCEEEMGESDGVSVDAPLHEMINECSKFIKSALQYRSETEATVRELHAILYQKDQQIEELNTKVAELSVSHDVVTSFVDSAQTAWSQSVGASPALQLEGNQHIEALANKMLASLATVVNQIELEDDSVSGKIVQAEKGTSLLVEKYGQILYEIEQLRQCLPQADSDIRVQDGFGDVLFSTRSELFELKRKEAELMERIQKLEGDNQQLAEKLDIDRVTIETSNEELGKLKTDLDQERTRSAATKEKLSMAVTKGKALVQQREYLKQLLADKTNELEKCLIELQEKSNALEAAEQNLAKSEKLVSSLQRELSEKDSIIDKMEEICSQGEVPEEIMSMELVQRFRYVMNGRNNVKEDLAKSENLIFSLQEMLSQRDEILGNFKDILSGDNVSEEVQSLDIIERLRWLINERNNLNNASTELQKVKDSFSTFELPESASSYDLESCMAWIKESLQRKEDEMIALKDEISRTREAIQLEIDRMSTLLSAELQEKEYLQSELYDLQCKYEELQEKEHQGSLEKDQMERKILEIAGISAEHQEGEYQSPSDISLLIDRFLDTVREQKNSPSRSSSDAEFVESIQCHLYMRSLDMTLYENILEEDMQFRSEANNLSNKLTVVSRELIALKEEKYSLQKDLERAEDKMTLLREKLSMAVKKGKGLVQDRENTKNLLEEKNSEIKKLKLELQQQESSIADSRDQFSKLSTELERIPQLEADIVTLREERDQIERFLFERSSMFQTVIESVDSIVLPVDSDFDQPTEKVKWIAEYINDCQDAKLRAEQETEKIKEEGNTLASQLEEAKTTIKSLEDALAAAQREISGLAEEKREKELRMANLEQELRKAVEEAETYSSKFLVACSTKQSLEDALTLAENRVSVLINEKEDAILGRDVAGKELKKVKEEISGQSSKLIEANRTIKSLESTQSQLEGNVALLTEQIKDIQVAKTNLETELMRLQDEAESQANKLADSCREVKSLENALSKAENDISVLEAENKSAEQELLTLHSKLNAYMKELAGSNGSLETELKRLQEEAESQANKLAESCKEVKSLKDALSKAENDISVLEAEKRSAEQELLTLDSKLNACMEELAGNNNSFKSRSIELIGHVNDLQALLKDERILPIFKQSVTRKLNSLKEIDNMLKSIRDHIIEVNPEIFQCHPVMKDDLQVAESLSDCLESIGYIEIEDNKADAENDDDISLSLSKTVDDFRSRNSVLLDKFEGFSSVCDESIADILRKLQATRDVIVVVFEYMESLKQKVEGMETQKQEQDDAMALLENDIIVLHSACSSAAKDLQIEVENGLLELSIVPEFENLKHSLSSEVKEIGSEDVADHLKQVDGRQYVKSAEELLLAAKKAHTTIRQFGKISNIVATTIKDLQNKVEETRTIYEGTIEEKDFNQTRVSELQMELESLQDTCRDLRAKLDDYHAKENMLKEREAEILSLQDILSRKEQEMDSSILSTLHTKSLFEKINGMNIPFAESELEDMDVHCPIEIRKLLYMADNFTELRHQLTSLAHDKEDLQTSLEAQKPEIKHLKQEVEKHINFKQDYEELNNQLSELSSGIGKLVQMLGSNELVGNLKMGDAKELLPVLQKQVFSMLSESESSKSKAHELNTKLLGSEKVVVELLEKVRFLESSLQHKGPEIIQERSTFDAPSLPTGSEISEIEDVEPVPAVKSTLSPVPSAALVRNTRKGSAEHLVLDMDMESQHLISNEESDIDKGHVFKSLSTSGLIPKQGKLIADRVDGIWVSSGRILMNRPRARLGLIAYWLFLHMWLLGTVL